jgi:hypothetical protein
VVSNLQPPEEWTMISTIWLAFAASLTPASAQTVAFDIDDQQAQQLGLDSAAIESEFGGAIGDQLNLVDTNEYLRSFANADAIALKGMGVDYASNPKKFSIGGTLGTGVADVPLTFSRDRQSLPDGGYAFMASLYAGLNLGALTPGDGPLDRVLLYANGLAFQPPGNKSFQGSMYNFGVHAQLKLVGPVNLKVTEWGGFDLTAGYERSYYELELSQALPLAQDLAPARFTWTATGNYTISSSADTIPLELSTNFRVLPLTVYAGGGLDINGASATSSASLSGPVDAQVNGETANLGTATVSISGEGKADEFTPRVFLGAQVNALALKVYGHLNIGLNDSYGGFLGVRVAM